MPILANGIPAAKYSDNGEEMSSLKHRLDSNGRRSRPARPDTSFSSMKLLANLPIPDRRSDLISRVRLHFVSGARSPFLPHEAGSSADPSHQGTVGFHSHASKPRFPKIFMLEQSGHLFAQPPARFCKIGSAHHNVLR